MTENAMLIGEFAARSHLSAKALRLYDELGLLVPDHVDSTTGYRYYTPRQLPHARLVALLRHLDMPLARIATVLNLPPADAAADIRDFWAERERDLRQRRPTVDYLCQLLTRKDPAMPPTTTYDVTIRTVRQRAVLSATRHVHATHAGELLGALLLRMREAGPGLPGLAGCPYTIYHGVVSDDSDGPVEIVRPMIDLATAERAATQLGDIQAHLDPAHDEASVRLTMAHSTWPAMLPALDALQAHLTGTGRTPAGPPRQTMIADWRTAAPDQPACDLTIPLHKHA